MPSNLKQEGSAPEKTTTHESVALAADALHRVGIETRLSTRDISAQVDRERVKALNTRDPSPGRHLLPIAIRAEESLRRVSTTRFCKQRLRQKLAEMQSESRK